jgi:hypothetical protein
VNRKVKVILKRCVPSSRSMWSAPAHNVDPGETVEERIPEGRGAESNSQ